MRVPEGPRKQDQLIHRIGNSYILPPCDLFRILRSVKIRQLVNKLAVGEIRAGNLRDFLL